MAVSTFTGAGGAAGGTNDFGGTLVGSFTKKDGSGFTAEIDLAAGSYLATAKCPGQVDITILAVDPVTLETQKSLATLSFSGGENSVLFSTTENYSKIFVIGLEGLLVFTKYESVTAAASADAGFSSVTNYLPHPNGTPSSPGYYDASRSVLQNSTHYFFRSQAQADSGMYSALNKTTRRGYNLMYIHTNGATPYDWFGQNGQCKIGVKDGLVIANGKTANNGAINRAARYIYDSTLDQYICKGYETGNVVSAPWSSSASNTSIVYMSHIDTFVATTNVDGYLYYSTDDGLTWSQGATCTASYVNLTYDAESQLLLIDTGGNISRSYFEYIADPTTGAATSWSYRFSGNGWYVPIYNAAGGFWTTTRYNANSNTYKSTSTGGSWETVSATFPSGNTGIPVVAGGKTYVPNGDIRSSGLGMVYSADGTNWTSVTIPNTRWYQGYTQSISQCWAVIEENYIKWMGDNYSGYLWDFQNDEAWMSGPAFSVDYYEMSTEPGGRWACYNSTRWSASVDGHRWYGSSYGALRTFKFFGGKFWCPTSSSYNSVSLTPNADGTWTIQSESGGSGYSPQGYTISGDFILAPSGNTSYSSYYSSNAGATWTSTSTYNRAVATPDGKMVAWADSPNYWVTLESNGNVAAVQYDSGSGLTNWTYASPYTGIPFKGGALIWYFSGSNLETYYVADNLRQTANSVNLSTIGFAGSSQGTGVLWEFAGTLFFDVIGQITSVGNSKMYQFVSVDGGGSWRRNDADGGGRNLYTGVYPNYATQTDLRLNVDYYKDYGPYFQSVYSEISSSYQYPAQADSWALQAPRKLNGRIIAG